MAEDAKHLTGAGVVRSKGHITRHSRDSTVHHSWESASPTLEEIAEVLRRHRDWKLRIAGHTDGIGGDQQNLDLSKRRAAAVKDALVKKYSIAAGRLETTGFGKSQPKDTNDTLEGRAHNRRVELMRIS